MTHNNGMYAIRIKYELLQLRTNLTNTYTLKYLLICFSFTKRKNF